MRLALAPVFAASLALSACATTPAPSVATQSVAPATYDGTNFKRQLYVVSDMERALRLWTGPLGMTTPGVTNSQPTSYSYDVFNIPREARLRFATLSAGPFQERTFALLEVTGVPLPRQTGIRPTGAVINANGKLDAIIAWARAEGLEIIPPRELRSATQGVGTEQAFLDWDDNVIVLYQFPVPAPVNRN
jgi:hypothetical protein